MVEDIQKAIDREVSVPVYQELLAQRLADALKCKVITRGNHGKFSTECIVEPE
jgi:UDP-N-acetylmuramate-alanine ligase